MNEAGVWHIRTEDGSKNDITKYQPGTKTKGPGKTKKSSSAAEDYHRDTGIAGVHPFSAASLLIFPDPQGDKGRHCGNPGDC